MTLPTLTTERDEARELVDDLLVEQLIDAEDEPMQQLGIEPIDRPLRAEPVRRDELLIDDGTLRTMPLGTWRLVERVQEWGTPPRPQPVPWVVGEPELWQPVLDELTAEVEQQRQYVGALAREHPAWAGGLAMPGLSAVTEMYAWHAREYRCEECGSWTL